MKICRVCLSQYSDENTTCPKDGTDLHSATDIAPGTMLGGKYEIVSKVGEGGMGAVFKAKSVSDGQIWALKVVAERLVQEPGFRQRFKSEALIMEALNHPNDVRVVDYAETAEGRPFTVMEFVDGPHLDELVPAGTKMDIARAVNLIIQVVDGLGAAHKMTIIHRDVKPDNIMVARTADGKEVAKLLDFGVAKVKEQGELFSTAKTAAGVMIGTPAYMSPEQVKGIPSDQLTGGVDLYAAGVILFELLCGRPPFVEKKPVMMLMAHAATPAPDPRQFRKELCPGLATAILRVLEKDPAKRFANAEEMHAALEAGLAEQLATAPAAAAAAPAPAAPPAAVPAAAPPAPPAPVRQAPPPSQAPPPPPPPAPARAAASDPESTAQIDRSKYAQPPPPPAGPVHVASHYSGKLPKAHAVVQYQKKRHWGRVIVILLVLATLLGAVIWLLAPRIRKLALRSERQVIGRTLSAAAVSSRPSGVLTPEAPALYCRSVPTHSVGTPRARKLRPPTPSGESVGPD
jgi:serine/threonine protein kinase